MIAETMALARYVWTKNRTITMILVVTAVATEIICLAATMLSINDTWRRWFAAINGSSIGICILYAVVLFEFGKSSSLTGTDGSYDRWLLRLPLPSWKLSLIPVGFITAWMLVMRTMLAITIQSLGVPHGPIITQSLAISAIAICTLAITWTSQRYPWQRLTTFFLSMPFICALGVFSIISMSDEHAPPWVAAIGPWLAIVFYVGSIALAMRSVRLARVSAYQQHIDGRVNFIEQMTNTIIKWIESWKITSGQFTSPIAALRWYDLARSQSNRWRLIGLFVVFIALSIVSFRLTAAPTAAAVIGLFLAGVGSITVAGAMFEHAVWANRSSLPSYLIASPLSSRTIAWTRLALTVKVATQFFAFVSLIFLANFMIDSNRELPTQLSQKIAAFAVAGSPLRTLFACHVGTLFFTLSLTLNSIWFQFYGRQQHSMAIVFLGMFIVSAPVSVALNWFMKQTDLQTINAMSLYWMQRIPSIVSAVTVLKLGVSALTIFLALRQQFVSVKLALQIVTVWALTVSVVATTFWLIWPGNDLPYHTVLIATTLVVPLAVIFASPLAVDANRHRGGKA